MSGDKQETELKDIGGLFRNKAKSGEVYYSGKGQDGTTYVMFLNKYWKEGDTNKPYFKLKKRVPKA